MCSCVGDVYIFTLFILIAWIAGSNQKKVHECFLCDDIWEVVISDYFFFLSKVSVLIKGWILWCEIIWKELILLLNLQILDLQMRHAALISNDFLPMEIFLLLASFFEDYWGRDEFFSSVANLSKLSSSWWNCGVLPISLFLCPWKIVLFIYFQTVSPSLINEWVINNCCFYKIEN